MLRKCYEIVNGEIRSLYEAAAPGTFVIVTPCARAKRMIGLDRHQIRVGKKRRIAVRASNRVFDGIGCCRECCPVYPDSVEKSYGMATLWAKMAPIVVLYL